MTREDMDVEELRAELAEWTTRLAAYAREYRNAEASGEPNWKHGIGIALDEAASHVLRLQRSLKLAAVA